METEQFDELFRSAARRSEEVPSQDPERMERLWKAIDRSETRRPFPLVRLLAAAVVLLLLNSSWFMTAYYRMQGQVKRQAVVIEQSPQQYRTEGSRARNEEFARREAQFRHQLDSLRQLLAVSAGDTVFLPGPAEYVYRDRIVYREAENKPETGELLLDSLLEVIAWQKQQLREKQLPAKEADSMSGYLSNASIVMEQPDERDFQPAQRSTSLKFNISLFKNN